MEQLQYETGNDLFLRGILAGAPDYSHENHGRVFLRFPLEILRLSGNADRVEVLAGAEQMPEGLAPGALLEIEGQLRSYNNRSGVGPRLVITAYARTIRMGAGAHENRVFLRGRLCRDPTCRRTPLGREIADVMLGVRRPYGRVDYLPCILWGSLARQAGEMRKGEGLWLRGRLQSRVYQKRTETGTEARTAFEVSAITAGPADPENPGDPGDLLQFF